MEDNQNIIIKESIYVISDDRKHDSAAVRNFMVKVNRYLVEKYGIKNEIQFSDGCAAHYRSKSAVADLSKIENLNVSRHYFKSSHGKSEADGLAAVLKNAVSRAVTQRKVEIFNVNDFFTYCENNLSNVGGDMMEIWPSKQKASKNSVRKFFFVSETEISRNNNSDKINNIQGILKVHSVKVVKPDVAAVRELACFCRACMDNQPDKLYVKTDSMYSHGESVTCVN